MGWGAQIHPSATISGPVYIGERVKIGPGARVGPHAVVGQDAIISSGAVVTEAVVEPRTYVGDALTVRRGVVREGWLMDADLGAAVAIGDRLLLGTTRLADPGSVLVRALVRLAAAAVWLLSLPLQILTTVVLRLVRPGPVIFRRMVYTPWRRGRYLGPRTAEIVTFDPQFGCGHLTAPRSSGPADVLLRFLPGLLSVARGDLALVGPEPRSLRSLAELPPHWRELAHAFPPGLITEPAGGDGLVQDPESVFAAEAVLVASDSLGFKLRVLGRYLRRGFSLTSGGRRGLGAKTPSRA